jgi:hypothetical protein
MKPAIQKTLLWAVLCSESSHIFCCVLPTVVSLAGLLAGAGFIIALPAPLMALHEALHEWELPMLVFSAFVLALGWFASWYSDRLDCHSTGCAHGACAPRKNRVHLVMKIATGLFIVNVLVYFFIHRGVHF